MVIAKYIGDLLFDYECVVIPGLGGFIINDKPASINYNTNYFNPPFREVMFNPYLLTNDGLLLNYIAKEENITYQQAKQKLDGFVIACHNALNNGKRIKFNKVGTIYKDKNGKIIFEQDTSVNYNPESFGLTSFISPAIRKPSREEKIKEVFKSSKPEKQKEEKAELHHKKQRANRRVVPNNTTTPKREKVIVQTRKTPYKAQMLFVAFLVFMLVGGWSYMHRDAVMYYYDAHAYKIPFFYSNPGSYVANNVEVLPVTTMADKLENLWIIKKIEDLTTPEKEVVHHSSDKNFTFDSAPGQTEKLKTNEAESVRPVKTVVEKQEAPEKEPAAIEEKTVMNTDKETVKTTVSQPEEYTEVVDNSAKETLPEVVPPKHGYFIIAGSFKDERNAQHYIQNLKQKGYNAFIAGTNRYGMTRVAFSAYPSLNEAKIALQKIRSHDNPSAWIMRK